MDALSAASSVFAVVSLALQLGSTIQNLIEFWDSVKEAPAKVADIKAQLGILSALHSSLKNDIRAAEYRENSGEYDVGLECLRVFAESIAKLERVVMELNEGLSGRKMRRRWTCLKKAIKDKELDVYWVDIEKAKSMLMLYQCWRNGQRSDFMLATVLDMKQNSLTIIPANLRYIERQSHSDHHGGFTTISLGCKTHEIVLSFGTFRIRVVDYIRKRKDQKTFEFRLLQKRRHKRIDMSLILSELLPWVPDWKFTMGFPSWKVSFQSLNLRPDGSRIFLYCHRGDILGVQRLLDEGLASPNDVDEEGMTALHHAAVMHHAGLCRMLINEGALATTITKRLQTPLILAADGIEYILITGKKDDAIEDDAQLDTIRVLVELGQNDPMDTDYIGYNALLKAAGTTWNQSLSWLLDQDTFELDFQYKTVNGYTAHAGASLREDLTPSQLTRFLRNGIDINAPCANWWYSPCANWWYHNTDRCLSGPSMLHYALWGWFDRLSGENDPTFHGVSSWPDRASGSPLSTVKVLFDHGADIHARSTSGHTILDGLVFNFIQFDSFARPPEVLARTMNAYFDLIKAAGISLPEYIRREEELHAGILYDLGIGLHMKLLFDENKSPPVSAAFQGPEEQERDEFMDHITKCLIWNRWREVYTKPKPQPRNIEAKYLPTAGPIVIRNGSCNVSGKLLSNQAQDNETTPFTFQHLSNQLTNFLRTAKQRLISSSKYRFEFSVYALFLSSIFGWGYFARFLMTSAVYATLRFAERLTY